MQDFPTDSDGDFNRLFASSTLTPSLNQPLTWCSTVIGNCCRSPAAQSGTMTVTVGTHCAGHKVESAAQCKMRLQMVVEC